MADVHKILRVITWLPEGGIEKRLCAVLPRLRERGFAPQVVCIRERGPLADKLSDAGIPVKVIHFNSRLDPRGIRALGRFIREEKFDLVHSHMYRSNVAVAMAKRFTRGDFPPIVCQIHNINTWQTWRQLTMERWLSHQWDMGVTVSGCVRDHVIDKLRLPPERCKVIYNGINLDEFSTLSERPSRREVFGIDDEDSIVVTSLCRLVAQKNPEAIVYMASKLCCKYPNLHFVLAGEGKLRGVIERECRRLNLSGRVHLIGQRSDVPRILASSDVFLLPSFKEGFSNAIVEAMAAGLPIVATDVGGNAEGVKDGESGYIVKVGDQDQLLDSLEQLVADAMLREKMGRASHERSRLFSLNKMIDDTVDLYTQLIAKKH